jgi:hypothetical protein
MKRQRCSDGSVTHAEEGTGRSRAWVYFDLVFFALERAREDHGRNPRMGHRPIAKAS